MGSTIIWAKFVVGGDGLVSFVRYIVYSIVGGKEKLLVPKLDFLLKHSKRRKAIFAMWRVKDGELCENKKCLHVKIRFYSFKSFFIMFYNLLSIKVWLLTIGNLSNLLSFYTCYLMANPWHILRYEVSFLNTQG